MELVTHNHDTRVSVLQFTARVKQRKLLCLMNAHFFLVYMTRNLKYLY